MKHRVDGNTGNKGLQWLALVALCAALAFGFVHAFDKESAIQDTVRAQRADVADTIEMLSDGTELHRFTVEGKRSK